MGWGTFGTLGPWSSFHTDDWSSSGLLPCQGPLGPMLQAGVWSGPCYFLSILSASWGRTLWGPGWPWGWVGQSGRPEDRQETMPVLCTPVGRGCLCQSPCFPSELSVSELSLGSPGTREVVGIPSLAVLQGRGPFPLLELCTWGLGLALALCLVTEPVCLLGSEPHSSWDLAGWCLPCRCSDGGGLDRAETSRAEPGSEGSRGGCASLCLPPQCWGGRPFLKRPERE